MTTAKIRTLLSLPEEPTVEDYRISQFQAKTMGSSCSTPHEDSVSAKRSRVIVFHSSSNWKIHFEGLKATNKLMVIDFTASWCGPCKQIDPAVHDFAAKYTDVEFIKIDVDELMDVAEEFRVEAMPTFLLIKKGVVVEKVVGAKKEELQMKIDKHRH